MAGYGVPQLSYGATPPIDPMALNFGQTPTTSFGLPPAGSAPPVIASPTMPVAPVAQAGITAPVAAPVAAGGQPQGFMNSLMWNGEGDDRTLNYDGLGLISQGISTLGSLYNSWQQNKLAKESLELQRDSYQTNLTNSTTSYNNSLEDRIRGKYTYLEQDDPAIQAELDKKKL